MSDPCLFGWSASEAVNLIKLCDAFIKAYSDGPKGAAQHFENLKTEVTAFKAILETLEYGLEKEDYKIYIGWDAINDTLGRCQAVFEGYLVYLRPKEKRGSIDKGKATAKYIWEGRDEVNSLCRALDGHSKYIMMYLTVLARYIEQIPEARLQS